MPPVMTRMGRSLD